jgi:hypothetical protein
MNDLILDDQFMGAKQPMWELDKEQPWHRHAAWIFGQGFGVSIKDVAQALGKSEPAVQNLCRQPWFQTEVNTILAAKGMKNDVMEWMRAEQLNSALTLVELRDNPKVPSVVRKSCATEILDRTMGKPVQRVETAQVAVSENPCAEVERLEQEVTRLKYDELRTPNFQPPSRSAAVIAVGETGGGTAEADSSNGQDEAHNA